MQVRDTLGGVKDSLGEVRDSLVGVFKDVGEKVQSTITTAKPPPPPWGGVAASGGPGPPREIPRSISGDSPASSAKEASLRKRFSVDNFVSALTRIGSDLRNSGDNPRGEIPTSGKYAGDFPADRNSGMEIRSSSDADVTRDSNGVYINANGRLIGEGAGGGLVPPGGDTEEGVNHLVDLRRFSLIEDGGEDDGAIVFASKATRVKKSRKLKSSTQSSLFANCILLKNKFMNIF